MLNDRKTKTFLFGFIDDCSRIVPFAQFAVSEKFDALKNVFKEALIRRGIPKIVYVDNGKIYRADAFHIACASLGIVLTHNKPALIMLLLHTGLRISEAVSLKVEDVIIRERSGFVRVRHGKGDKYREVPLNVTVRRVLDR